MMLGRAVDELALNIQLCHHRNVKVKGVVVNKVARSKVGTLLDGSGENVGHVEDCKRRLQRDDHTVYGHRFGEVQDSADRGSARCRLS